MIINSIIVNLCAYLDILSITSLPISKVTLEVTCPPHIASCTVESTSKTIKPLQIDLYHFKSLLFKGCNLISLRRVYTHSLLVKHNDIGSTNPRGCEIKWDIIG